MEHDEEAPLLAEPRFYHFKVLYDPSWDYKALCERFFMAEHPYLCVVEHVNKPNVHVHFQGTSRLQEGTVKARLTRLARQHHLRKLNPRCRPTSMSARPVDVKGFQYMAKEVQERYVLAVNKFTMAELTAMKAQSTLHCKEIKTVVQDFIKDLERGELMSVIDGSKDARTILERMGKYLCRQQRLGKINLPVYSRHYTRESVLRGLLLNPHLKEEYYGWLMVI